MTKYLPCSWAIFKKCAIGFKLAGIGGKAYLENYALKLFTYADQQDRASNFNK